MASMNVSANRAVAAKSAYTCVTLLCSRAGNALCERRVGLGRGNGLLRVADIHTKVYSIHRSGEAEREGVVNDWDIYTRTGTAGGYQIRRWDVYTAG